MEFPFSRRRFLQFGAAALMSGGAVGAYTVEVEPHWIEVVHRPLPIAHLPAQLVGRTLVQLSDIHIGRAVSDSFLFGAFQMVEALAPDLLVITGDFMTCYRDEQLEHSKRVLERLPHGRLGTLAVLGNHDYGMPSRYDKVADALSAGLRNQGVDVLRNETRNVAGLRITGLDDYLGTNFDPEAILAEIDVAQANLVLCHNPDVCDLDVWSGYRGWILAGHTHGGQCKPPFFDPPYLPVRNKRYTAGEFDLYDGRRLYINRALGNLMHIRFNVRPEITVFTLKRA